MSVDYGLGRLPAADVRDTRFPMRALLAAALPVKQQRYYRTGPVLDQGRTSSCVGHAWRQFLSSAPLMTRGGPDALSIYRESQKVDEWPGEEPAYFGTSVRAGVKCLQGLGHIGPYHWAWDAATVRDWLLSDRGTVVLGTDWYAAYGTPDREGIIQRQNSPLRGGHAYLCIGYSAPRGLFRCVNSWGADWGQRGRFWIAGEELDHLLLDGGEACVATEALRP